MIILEWTNSVDRLISTVTISHSNAIVETQHPIQKTKLLSMLWMIYPFTRYMEPFQPVVCASRSFLPQSDLLIQVPTALSTSGTKTPEHGWKVSETSLPQSQVLWSPIAAFDTAPAPITTTAFNRNGTVFAYAISYDWSKGHSGMTPGMPNKLMLHACKD